MLIQQLAVRGFKSLRNVSLTFTNLTVLVGPNGAGKTNLARSIEFLADVYRTGVTDAISNAGGIENLLSEGSARQVSTLEFSLLFVGGSPRFWSKRLPRNLAVRHTFSLRRSAAVRLGFTVAHEQIELMDHGRYETTPSLLTLIRDGNSLHIERKRPHLQPNTQPSVTRTVDRIRLRVRAFAGAQVEFPPFELMIQTLSRAVPELLEVTLAASSARVYEIDPDLAREDAEKAARPEMTTYGANLPSVLRYMKSTEPRIWESIIAAMRGVTPQIEDILLDDRHTGNLGIFFKETRIQMTLTAAEVSSGTMRSLALFAAIFDPRTAVLAYWKSWRTQSTHG